MAIYLRDGSLFEYNENQDRLLEKLYSHKLGRSFVQCLIHPFVSYMGGLYMNSALSAKRIKSFIQSNDIDMSQYLKEDYVSFNEFFIRKIKDGEREINQASNVLIAPCDSKLSCFKIDQNVRLKIKNTVYSLEDLLMSPTLASRYQNGYALIFRLTVDDYHRYHFFDDGTSEKEVHIPGYFHTVNPIANDYYPIYKTNSRTYTLLHTKHFDDVIMMEVGALMVGKITNHHKKEFSRGEEKGYFEFGGSTVVLFIKDIVDIDQDIINNSAEYNETKVLLGERIGILK